MLSTDYVPYRFFIQLPAVPWSVLSPPPPHSFLSPRFSCLGVMLIVNRKFHILLASDMTGDR